MASLTFDAKIAVIPSWTFKNKEPSVYTFFESVSLAGLEEKRIKLSAAMQRTLLGCVVFGRRELIVHKDGSDESSVETGYGHDMESAIWSAEVVQRAAKANKQLRPGTTGKRYFLY